MNVFVSIPQNTEVNRSFFPEWIRDYLAERCDVKYSPLDRQIVPEEMVQYAADADVIITGWGHPTITKEMVAKTNVHLVVHTGGSVGSLIDPDIYDIGVRVISGNDLYADSVAEGTLAFMMAMLRQIPDYVDNIRNGGWNFQENCTEGLYNQRIGIIGFGAISKRVVQLLRPFNVNIKIYSGYPIDEQFLHDNNAKQVTLDELFSTCRIVSLHSSMNEKNRGLIGKEHFERMENGAIFINTARGAVVREEEMIEELKKQRIRAVLDVFCQEPLPVNSPLRRLPNVYCIPHKAGPTYDRRAFVTKCLIDDIVRFENKDDLSLEIKKEYSKRMTVGG